MLSAIGLIALDGQRRAAAARDHRFGRTRGVHRLCDDVLADSLAKLLVGRLVTEIADRAGACAECEQGQEEKGCFDQGC
jgi:hypothetical protein